MVFEKLKSYRYLSKYSIFNEYIKCCSSNIDPENALIDFKIHDLKVGECPSRPIWHYDGTNSPTTADVVLYSLFLYGCDSRTKFFVEEPPLVDGTEREIHQYATKLEVFRDITYIKMNTWTDYCNKNLHAATPALENGTRILIRLKEKNG